MTDGIGGAGWSDLVQTAQEALERERYADREAADRLGRSIHDRRVERDGERLTELGERTRIKWLDDTVVFTVTVERGEFIVTGGGRTERFKEGEREAARRHMARLMAQTYEARIQAYRD